MGKRVLEVRGLRAGGGLRHCWDNVIDGKLL